MKTSTAFGILVLLILAGVWWAGRSDPEAGEPSAGKATAHASSTPVAGNPAEAHRVQQGVPSLRSALVLGERGPVTVADLPEGRFRDQLLAVAPEAQAAALATLEKLRVPLHDLNSLHVDRSGALFYACTHGADKTCEHLGAAKAGDDDQDAHRVTEAEAPAVFAVSVPSIAPPIRHSKPGASKVIYLDFNGHTVTGTAWNTNHGQAAFVCTPYDTDGNSDWFSPDEQMAIVRIWERVAEDFRTFDVDVTTEEPAVFNNQTARVLITKDRDANGVWNPAASEAGGVAYLNVFGLSNYASTYSVAFVYYQGTSLASVAMVVSHEVGHNMGLSHDGAGTVEYYAGHGNGVTSWAPIMGSGSRNILQWSKGDYYNSNNSENDIAIIAGKLGTLPDDHANTNASATPLAADGAEVQGWGIIEGNSDVDRFSFTTGAGAVSLTVAANSYPLGFNTGALDVVAELLDASGAVLAQSNPTDSTAPTINQTLAAGTYFLRVSPTGVGNPFTNPPSGYTAYGSIGGYGITGTIVAPAGLVAPVIVRHPENQTLFSGTSTQFEVVAKGNPANSYQWERSIDGGGSWQILANDATYGGTTSRILTVSGVGMPMNGHRFHCVVNNSAGSVTSNPATLTVYTINLNPVITAHPVSKTVVVGTGVTFNVTVIGTGPFTYQWRKNGVDIPGATNASFTIGNAQLSDTGDYTVVVGNDFGSVTSHTAVLTVNVAPPTITSQPGSQTVVLESNPATFSTVKFVAAGHSHSLAVMTDGTLWAMGSNYYGQLGDGTNKMRTTPGPVAAGVATAAAGNAHSLFVKTDGTLWVMGYNYFGQLGDGTKNQRSTPVPVATGVAAVAAGYAHSLFVKTDGTLWVMGDNYNGQLGDGTTTQRITPVQVASGVAAVTAGGYHSLFVKTDGTLWAMGSNSYGQLGDGTNTNRPTPVQVATGVAAVAANNTHSLFVKTDGTLWASGSNNFGQLGDGTTVQRVAAVPVATGVAAVTAGNWHSLFMKTDGTVWAMGRNGFGELGDGTTTQRVAPIQVATGVVSVAAGDSHSLFVKTGGTLWAMGSNDSGQLGEGDGLTIRRSTPVPVVENRLTVSFSVTATGAPPFTYQWRKNYEPIAGATGTSYTIIGVQSSHGGSYTVDVSNAGGSVTSQTAVLTVNIPPRITLQPASQGVAVGGSASFSVASIGNWPFSYQWKKEGVDIPGATASAFTLGSVQYSDAGNYTVVISNAHGSVTSHAAVLTVNSPFPVITTPPESQAMVVGGFVIFNVTLTGLPPFTYQWRKNGMDIPGATSSSYFIWSAQVSDVGSYAVVVSNASGSVTSQAAVLTVNVALPIITTQPASQVVSVGGGVTFTIGASGMPPLYWQWKKDGVNIPGANWLNFTIANVQPSHAGNYTVVVSNASGSVTSQAAVLTVGAVGAPGRLVNLSIRTRAGADSETLIVGFVTEGGTENASLLVRAAGPALADYGVTGVLADSHLAIHNAASQMQSNDDWSPSLAATFAQVGAFPWTVGSKDAAVALALAPALYTAVITDAGGGAGIALAEIYDVNPAFEETKPKLVNVSARAQVDTGASIMIAGFVIAGDTPKAVLIRAVGPTLSAYGVDGVLADPQLAVFSGPTQVGFNNDWEAPLAATFAQVGAFPLGAGSKDAALLVTLAPGVYTAQVSGVGGTTGVALVEVYAVP